jgi:hypothetical protein
LKRLSTSSQGRNTQQKLNTELLKDFEGHSFSAGSILGILSEAFLGGRIALLLKVLGGIFGIAGMRLRGACCLDSALLLELCLGPK